MSHSHLSPTSSNFQLIFNNALKTYNKRTGNDLLNHPLTSQLQGCDTPSAILAVLQQQVDQSRNSDDRWTRWLSPTVHVINTYSTSTTLEGVGLVSLRR